MLSFLVYAKQIFLTRIYIQEIHKYIISGTFIIVMTLVNAFTKFTNNISTGSS